MGNSVDVTRNEQDRAARWKALGFVTNPLPKDMALFIMRGGHQLAGPQKGDAVDLYINDPEGKSKDGQWVSGYIAVTDIMEGELGGEFDGGDVMWVSQGNPNEGQEWPADCLRLSRGEKPAFQPKPDSTGTTAKFDGVANFFSDTELRDWRGRWTAGGIGGPTGSVVDPSIVHGTPMGKQIEAIVGGTPVTAKSAMARIVKLGLSPQILRDNVRGIWQGMTPASQKVNALWYYEVHDLATAWAKEYHTTIERVSATIAALSPQVMWGEPGESEAAFAIHNQVLTSRVLELAFTRKDEVLDVDERVAARLNAPSYKSEDGKAHDNKAQVNAQVYDGTDPAFVQGADYTGKHKLKDLPADIVGSALKPHGAMATRAALALMLARGASTDTYQAGSKTTTILNGPKTRSFYNNIVDPDNSTDATIDVHMLGVLAGIKIATLNAPILQGAEAYRIFSQAIQDVANELGVKPHELQAATWSRWSRELHTDKGEKRAILKAAGLTTEPRHIT